MKTKLKIAMAALISAFAFAAGTEVVACKLTMNLKVPRVYDNMKSIGCLVSDITPLCGSFSMNSVARYPNCTLK